MDSVFHPILHDAPIVVLSSSLVNRSIGGNDRARIPGAILANTLSTPVNGLEGAFYISTNFYGSIKKNCSAARVDPDCEMHFSRNSHRSCERSDQAKSLKGAMHVILVLLNTCQVHRRFCLGYRYIVNCTSV